MAAQGTSALIDNSELIEAAKRRIEAELPESMKCFEVAQQVVPGASGRSRFFWPIPTYIDHADGAYMYDVDGRRYVDCVLGLGPMILGHRHPEVLSALQEQLERGWHFGPPVREEAALGRLIVDNVPGGERVVFVGSGTEASLAALHIARAATGRSRLAKFEGGYHGWHDFGMGSLRRAAGPPEQAQTTMDGLGRSPAAAHDIVALPFNHPAAFERIRREAADLACVFIEGVQASSCAVVAERDFVHELRAVCDECGVLLIFDEVITGFRLGPSGAAGYFDVTPDMTTLGKVIGGGFPIGAVCGRADLLNLILPNARGESVVMAGTFSANPMTMVAGKAQLSVLLRDDATYPALNRLGDRLRQGLTGALADTGVPGHITGAGSIYGVHLFAPAMPRSSRDRVDVSKRVGRVLDGYLLLEGVLQAPMHGFLSTAHSEADVDLVIGAYGKALARMKEEGFFAG
ncbi:MAG TPA: aspartate aminotransferase family protein [Chloroflexota bacterium]|nr:aspartate aminotransferase family protein [Chloroflexota bacterium]